MPIQQKPSSAFNAPIPGESLTQPPGSSAFEHPPQFSDVEMALEATFDKLTASSKEIALMLKAGTPAETIARNVLFSGFAQGQWTPDVAHLMGNVVLGQIVALGQRMGLKDIKLANPRSEKDMFMSDLVDLANKNESTSFAAPEPEAPKEEPMQLGGILG